MKMSGKQLLENHITSQTPTPHQRVIFILDLTYHRIDASASARTQQQPKGRDGAEMRKWSEAPGNAKRCPSGRPATTLIDSTMAMSITSNPPPSHYTLPFESVSRVFTNATGKATHTHTRKPDANWPIRCDAMRGAAATVAGVSDHARALCFDKSRYENNRS